MIDTVRSASGHQKRHGILYLVAILVLVFWAYGARFYALDDKAGGDFLQYWSASRILQQGGNPYDAGQLAALQRQVWSGGTVPIPIRMWNPPSIFPLIVPLSYFDFDTAYLLWFVASTVIFFLCCTLAFQVFSSKVPENNLLKLARIIFFVTFSPFATSLYYGQISPLLLISITLFLYFAMASNRGVSHSFWGGIFLSISFIKPHILYLLYIYILLFSFKDRKFRTLLGMLCGGLILSIPPIFFRVEVWQDYLFATSSPPIYFITPTIGCWLQAITGFHIPFVRMLPTFITAMAAICYFCIRKPRRNALMDILLIVPLSLITSPYGWVFDQMVMVPGIMLAFSLAAREAAVGRHLHAAAQLSIMFSANMLSFFLARFGQQYSLWYPVVFLAVGFMLVPRQKGSAH